MIMDVPFMFVLLLSIHVMFLIPRANCGRKSTHFKRNFCLRTNNMNELFVQNTTTSIKTYSRAHCASICSTKYECTSFSFNNEDGRCTQTGIMQNDTQTESAWENYYSNISNSRNCNGSGFTNTFTEHIHQDHPNFNIRCFGTGGGTLNERQMECEQACLLEMTCRAYELNAGYTTCCISAVNKWDKRLVDSSWSYFHRNYDCGCPPSQKENIQVCYTSTLDGSNVTYVCPDNNQRFTYMCTTAGWGLGDNDISC